MTQKNKSKKATLPWELFFKTLTVINFIFIVFALWFFFFPFKDGIIKQTTAEAQRHSNLINMIQCLRDEVEGVDKNNSANCLSVERESHISQCELRRKNPNDKEWEELEKDCQEIDRIEKRLQEISK